MTDALAPITPHRSRCIVAATTVSRTSERLWDRLLVVMTRAFIVLATLGWALGACVADERRTQTHSSGSTRPNVLLIVTDDQGYGDLGAHGNPHLKTPNLDRLRSTGVRLEDYHVDPVCTPTRAALMTGRYCGRVGAWSVTHGRQLLHRRERTIADVFRQAGYRTGMFGKWHLGDPWPYDPSSRGFEEVVCCRAGGVDEIGNPLGNDYFDDTYFRNGIAERFDGYCTDVFTSEAVRFIKRATSDQDARPFLVYLATNAMHSPFNVADRYAQRFRDRGLPENRARFYGMIENFDENLGELLGALEETGQSQDTIVVFFGDNGTAANSGSEGAFNAGMRGDKGTVYEGGHRVACFVSWPGGLPQPAAVEQLTSHQDWLPTLIDLCDLPSPEGVRFDGRSLAPLLQGDHEGWPERTLFVERQAVTPIEATAAKSQSADRTGAFPQYAVLTERWRLVNRELYDIHADPAQEHNVATEHATIVSDLQRRYRDHFHDVFAHVEEDARFIVGDPAAAELIVTARDWRPTRGGVIWETGQLDSEDLNIQGYWPIEVSRPGRYRIDLTRYPFSLDRPIGARRAELRLGEITLTQELDPSDSVATFETWLDAGRARLQGTFTQHATNTDRGPYYVRLTTLGY